jgi:hypothetical protein
MRMYELFEFMKHILSLLVIMYVFFFLILLAIGAI